MTEEWTVLIFNKRGDQMGDPDEPEATFPDEAEAREWAESIIATLYILSHDDRDEFTYKIVGPPRYGFTVIDRDGGEVHISDAEYATERDADIAGADWEDHPAYGSHETWKDDK